MPIHTAAITLAAIALYFFLATRVAVARRKFGVTLPATTGNEDFERVFRVHQNTLEWLPTFLVSLWICALYLSDTWAAVGGIVWVIGRAVYAVGYNRAVQGRLPGFFIQALATTGLFGGAAFGVVRHFMAG